jgi:16S rRNA (guanine(966)-N(2))-methyltransferase RsmD
VKNLKARPTTDRAKESLFNILNNQIDFSDIIVLDLFGGTGGISYEFASRGCEKITIVEKNYNHVKYIKSNSNEFNFGFNIVKADVFKFLKNSIQKYDIIFADPPFDMLSIEDIPKLIFENNLLKESGMLILEHSDLFDFKQDLKPKITRHYGKVCFSFFEL